MTATYPYDVPLAVRTLRRRDRELAALMDCVGPFNLGLRDDKTPFQSLLQSIVYQMISTKSAAATHGRTMELFPNRYPSARRLRSISDEDLLAAGLSRAKVAALRDLSERCIDGRVPRASRLRNMTDDEVLSCLQQVRGVGVWTAEMLLIFNLGRPDILPVGDLGIRRGFRMAYGLDGDPAPAELLHHGERWRPYRTVAAWYLWRANYL